MTPTSPSDPDRKPAIPAPMLDGVAAAERETLLRVWHAAEMPPAPPPTASQKEATWARLQAEMRAPRPAVRPDRPPVRASRPRQRIATVFTAFAAVALLAIVMTGVWRGEPAARTWSAAPGSVTSVQLPDGSAVQLEAGAVLHQAAATSERRSYVLSGSATFSVARDEKRPFVVETAQATVTVLGTTFTVRAEDATRTRVTVQEGRVAVTNPARERVELGSGEQTVAASSEPLVARALPASPAARFAFDDAPLRDVLREIELLFGTSIAFPASAAEARITITRHGPLDAEGLLESVCAPLGLQFRPGPDGYVVYRPS